MSAAEWLIASLSFVAVLGLVLVVVGGWAAYTCEHPPLSQRRHWFRHHRYIITCTLCQRTIKRGRDVGHRYPDGARGVRRGARSSA